MIKKRGMFSVAIITIMIFTLGYVTTTSMANEKAAYDDYDEYEGYAIADQGEGPREQGCTNSNDTSSYSYSDGSLYTGEMLDGMPNGEGTITYPDGTVYEGEVFDGEPNGQGSKNFSDGDYYSGDFSNGMLDGNGELDFAEDDDNGRLQYTGEFNDDYICGYGTMTYRSGDQYTGEFKDDLKDGQGTYSWSDGSKYTGAWEKDLQNGQGVEYDPQGEVVHQGQWVQGKPVNSTSNNSVTTNNNSPSTNSNITNSGNTTSGSVSSFTLGSTIYHVNGSARTMDVAPFSQDNRTFVPLRYLGLALGVDERNICWDSNGQCANLTLGSEVVSVKAGSYCLIHNGKAEMMDVVPMIVDGRVFLPARFVAEAFSGTVGWDPGSRTVTVSNGSTSASEASNLTTGYNSNVNTASNVNASNNYREKFTVSTDRLCAAFIGWTKEEIGNITIKETYTGSLSENGLVLFVYPPEGVNFVKANIKVSEELSVENFTIGPNGDYMEIRLSEAPGRNNVATITISDVYVHITMIVPEGSVMFRFVNMMDDTRGTYPYYYSDQSIELEACRASAPDPSLF